MCVAFKIALFSILTILCSSDPTPFKLEEACARTGGQCMLQSECPYKIPSEYLNLCPEQKKAGAECCHRISLKETRCKYFGGQCTTKYCPPFYTQTRAKDCAEGEKCCIYVR